MSEADKVEDVESDDQQDQFDEAAEQQTPRQSGDEHSETEATPTVKRKSDARNKSDKKTTQEPAENEKESDADNTPKANKSKNKKSKKSKNRKSGPPLDTPSADAKAVQEQEKAPVAESEDAPSTLPTNANGNSIEPLQETAPTPEQSAERSRPVSMPPAATAAAEPEPPAPGQGLKRSRTLRSPFSFFSRGPSGSKDGVKSPPPSSGRRGTTSSVSTLDSISAQSRADENKRPDRNSLKDRFKLLRMQEEAGIKWVENATEDGERPDSSSSKVELSAMMSPTDEEAPGQFRPRTTSVPGSPLGPIHPPNLNEALAPGTAAGTSTGPALEQAPNVDWDLWQAVVYEGPAAVARTSAAELNSAISNGIPSAIRGVVWQVLANSQSTELESIYGDLVKRGADSDKAAGDAKHRSTDLKREESGTEVNGNAPEKESTASSAASVHSAFESPGSPTSDAGIASPATSQDANSVDASAKAAAKLAAEEKKRAKDEDANLQKLERTIKRDLGARTSYSKFLMSAGLQTGLFGICKAYALYDEELGYAQGMNFVAMPLLFNMPVEEAFCLFVRLMNQYKLRDMFIQDMPGLHLHLYQFERLLEDFEPAVFCHLSRRGVNPQLYATQWFLTLFAYRFPLQLVLRIYDLILSEGLESAILKFGVVLMQKNAQKLLEMKDMAALTTFLKERLFDVYIDKSPSASSVLESGFFGSAGGIDKEVYRADALVQDACAIKITPEMLKQYTKEWEDRTREQKAKQTEDETLRTTNAALLAQVKTLQERHEKDDAEHVQIANSLVNTQMANQKLSDDNESLRTQISELRTIVSAQPAEVEERLRAEMDRIMQRNMEVQNSNRHLEEQVEHTENELVRAKLSNAEMTDELEQYKARWHNVSALMSGKGSPRIG